MCYRRFAQCLGVTLILLALCCVVANALLFFPNGETEHFTHLTKYVWFLGGIVGGGVVMFLPAVVLLNLGDCDGCCGNTGCGKSCAMLGTVVAHLFGLFGSGYCFIISAVAMTEGPHCRTSEGWVDPFFNQKGAYLTDRATWAQCQEPRRVVEWNVTLFAIQLAIGGVEVLICGMQMINRLVGGICGGCCQRNHYSLNA